MIEYTKNGDLYMNIGMIGCGWLGKPLAEELKRKYAVQCYSRSPHEDKDLDHVYLPSTNDKFWSNELFIISISTKDEYLSSLENFLRLIPSSSKIIFMSSTSIYKGLEDRVDEESILVENTLQKQAEELVLSFNRQALILRLGGLMGEDRIAGKWKSTTPYADGPVNYIHLEDILIIISKLIDKNILQGIYNLVAPEHPFRSSVHKNNAKMFGFEEGSYNRTTGRFVDSSKLIKVLSYDFTHPNPLEFWT